MHTLSPNSAFEGLTKRNSVVLVTCRQAPLVTKQGKRGLNILELNVQACSHQRSLNRIVPEPKNGTFRL